jgi:hypothetical protein
MLGIILLHYSLLPEVDVECYSDTEDNNRVDNVPLGPAAFGSFLLLGSRGAEYETLDLCLRLGLSAEAHDEADEQAEYQHASAEEQPVEVIEYSLEPTFRSTRYAGVENFGSQAGKTYDKT